MLCAKVPIYPVRLTANTRSAMDVHKTRDYRYNLLIGDRGKQLRYDGKHWGNGAKCRDERIILPENANENDDYRTLTHNFGVNFWLGAIKESGKYVNWKDGSDLDWTNWDDSHTSTQRHVAVLDRITGKWLTTEDGNTKAEQQDKTATVNHLFCEDDVLSE